MKRSIVFVHAFPLDASMWDEQATAARSLGWQVLAPDLPGFGRCPPGEPDLAAFARHVLAECDRAGVERAVFVGLSMGGYVVFRIAALARERIAGLILLDTRASADPEPARLRRTHLAERVRREGVAFLADEILPSLLGETTRRDRADLVGQVKRRILAADPEGVARALLAMRDRPDSTPLLADLDVPALVGVGEEDALTTPEEARALAARLSQAQYAVFPRAGHLSNLEAPAEVNQALTRFLEGLSV